MTKRHRYIFSVCWFIILGTFTAYSQARLIPIANLTGDTLGTMFCVVANVGDVNGDGYDDFVVGAPGGKYARLYLGGPTLNTTRYIKLAGDQPGSRFGWSVAGGGDLNGDGYPDIVIGAPWYSYGGNPDGTQMAGAVYVYFGGPTIHSTPDLILRINGWYYNFGQSVSIAGDLNHDGYSEIVVGAPNDDVDAHGRVYVYFGGTHIDTIPSAVLEGQLRFDSFGASVEIVGDVNKDGYDDLLIGAPQFLTKQEWGKAYLVYGGKNISLTNSTIFVSDSLADQFGREVTSLGDINHDGYPDLGIVGLKRCCAYFGGSQVDTTSALTFIAAGKRCVMAGVGDLNQDGFNDLVIVSDTMKVCYGGSPLGIQYGIPLPFWAYGVSRLGHISNETRPILAIGNDQGSGSQGPGYVVLYAFDTVIGAAQQSPRAPDGFALSQNYPNPFNPTTSICYEIPSMTLVRLDVYDLLGRLISTLVNEVQQSGQHQVSWNASTLSSGVYFCRLTVSAGRLQRAMVLTK
jgi:hypothetical protein